MCFKTDVNWLFSRYGTEENLYEEIGDIERARLFHKHNEQLRSPGFHQYRHGRQSSLHSPVSYEDEEFLIQERRNVSSPNSEELHIDRRQSSLSLKQSLLEEEFIRVQNGHRRVLGELNLSFEAMLMPSSSSSREGSEDVEKDKELDDQLADLLTVGPTDELLSPVAIVDLDSGFSGSSSGASYRSVGGSLRRTYDRHHKHYGSASAGCSTSMSAGNVSALLSRCASPCGAVNDGKHRCASATDVGDQSQANKGFWGKKALKKLGFTGGSSGQTKQKGEILRLDCVILLFMLVPAFMQRGR